MFDQLARDRRKVNESHEKNNGLGRADLAPVDLLNAVPRDERYRRRMFTMRQRDAAISRQSQRRGYARYDLERNPRSRQRFHLLAAPPEDERIAALEPHHRLAAPRALDQHSGDLFLSRFMRRALLADVHPLGMRGRQVQQAFARQVIVEDGIGALQNLAALDGNESGIARTRADQINLRGHDPKMSRAPAPNMRSPSSLPSAAGSPVPAALSRISRAPSGEATIAIKCSAPPSNRPCAP